LFFCVILIRIAADLAFEPQCLNIPNGGTKLDPLLNIGYRNKRSPINHATLSTTHSTTADSLDGCEDEYDGVIINPQCLPTSANAFAAILRSSLSYWKLKKLLVVYQMQGKKGIWLKLLEEQAELVPVALKLLVFHSLGACGEREEVSSEVLRHMEVADRFHQ
ncbi:hypothetical protein BHE74_00022526, partial [Ensete ventricosum]